MPLEIYVPTELEYESLTDDSHILDIKSNESESESESLDFVPNKKHKTLGLEHKIIEYDEDTLPLVDEPTATTASCTALATDSAADASICSEEYFEIDLEEQTFTYRGPKSMPQGVNPTTIATADTIGAIRSRRLFRVLLDSGASKTFIKRSAIPKGAALKDISTMVTTMGGRVQSTQVVTLRDLRLPEFDKNRRIDMQKALVFDNDNCKYDIILGTDFLKKTGIKLDYDTGHMIWFDTILPLRPARGLTAEEYDVMCDMYHVQTEDELFGEDWLKCFATEILDAKYELTDVKDVAKRQLHLTEAQREALSAVLERHAKLFDGTLGVYPHRKFHIEIEPDATPVFKKAYPIPRIHLSTFKKELDHLVALGVLVPQQEAEWASPTFIIPKKDGRVRWISDLRQLNKVVKRRQYPLPLINEVLRKRSGYKFFSKLDISMQYYTFELDDESQDLCTINTPFGLYKYARLPMGLKCSPDFAQAVMENILRDVDDAEVYIDDVGAFSNDWDSHLKLLDTILGKLRENGFTVNPLKCEWAVKETDWLGYWLTPRGLKPWKKKIEAILHMDRPRTSTDLRMFIGAVNYYRDMWPSRAHILKPLTDVSGLKKKTPLNWTDDMQKAFDKMRLLLAADALAAYPDHNKPFQIYTDASDFQLGAAIVQEGRVVAYFSRKLNSAQKNYTTMEKEMLAIVATLEEFRSMLLGAEIHVHTDHKNLTFDVLKTQRVLRWRTKIEEYSPFLHYIEGPKNILADNLSRLHRLTTPAQLAEGKKLIEPAAVTDDECEFDEAFLLDTYDPEILEVLECYLNLPEAQVPENNPLSYEYIAEQQQQDEKLQALRAKYPKNYFYKRLDDDVDEILCHVKDGHDYNTQWRIALPESMLDETVKWFHIVLGHPGEKRLRETLTQRYWHPRLRHKIDHFKCGDCQKHKLDGRGYGLLPEREVKVAPWEEVAIDLIGPWEIKVNGRMVEFNALTCIDTATNLVEMIRIDNKSAAHIRDKFAQSWLSRYPRPVRCVHDKGGEFIGAEFQWLLTYFNVKNVCSTSKNPQSNSICERMHQTVGNILRTELYSNPPKNMTDAKNIIDSALATAMHAMRTTVATTIGSTPGALAFSRDMFLNVPLIADWQAISRRREHHVNENLRRANAKRRQYDYVAGQLVLKKVHKPTKLGVRTEGPYKVQRVHVNGTLTIELRPGLTERINIRRLIPYRSTDNPA